MRIYNNDNKNIEEYNSSNKLSNLLWKENISIWQSYIKKDNTQSVYFLKDIGLKEYIKGVVNPLKYIPKSTNKIIDDVVTGIKPKSELFAFCPATFHFCDEHKRVRRLKTNYKTFTKLVQLDLDLKNEDNCTEEYVNKIQEDIFTLTELGEHIFFCGKSISGKGLYAFILLDTDNLEKINIVITKVYQHLKEMFNLKNDATLDSSVKDVYNRLRYYSPDANLIVNDKVKAINTSKIIISKKEDKPIYLNLTNEDDELKKIKLMVHKHLSDYPSNTIYKTGFDNQFCIFACACRGAGVSKQTLLQFTINQYNELYNYEKKINYLNKLKTVLDNADKFINKNKSTEAV